MSSPEKPGSLTGKKAQVEDMFNAIARRYDFLNHFLSLGFDIYWRKKAVSLLKTNHPQKILDIATGTGDLAIESLSVHPQKVLGIDISEKMLHIGKEKIKRRKIEDIIELTKADAEHLPFANNTFDAITVGFGVRNFTSLEKGLKEMNRVLKQDGKAVILEFSNPKKFPVKQLYNFYFLVLLPLLGRFISKHNFAYSYLPQSVTSFPDGKDFINIFEKAGFNSTKYIPLSFGIVSIYIGNKT
ncbi:MAG: bifunctional demethylmenaquinone methyltransferase/2-methoxy-6-polyprenyl-1,4-benzoquinol methylase UbiE [Bacteroidota bacterium]